VSLLRDLGIDENEVRDCPDCGATELRVTAQTCSVNHAQGDAVTLSAILPVWTCRICGLEWKDGRGEVIEEETIIDFLGRKLLPQEIRSIREGLGLSRGEFARVTNFGLKSVERWERGLLVQNASADNFLRLLADEDVAQKLLRLNRQRRK
jgi:putative zinc finger/helix-turn-helix YgiT family protein